MTSFEQPPRRRPPKRSTGSALARVAALLTLAVFVFLLGVAFSRALDERPRTGAPVTTVQTLEPRPQEVPAHTVTETVTQP